MIEPAVTSCPANTFTPSRCAFESRPFFEEPRPFLCAICRHLLLLRLGGRLLARPRLLGRTDALDRDPRELGAVAAGALVAALGLELEHLDLRPADVLDDRGRNGARELGAVGHDAVAAGEQHLGRERLACVHRLPIDQERLPLLDPVLLSTDLDHRVHELLQRKTTPADAGGRIVAGQRHCYSPSSRLNSPPVRFGSSGGAGGASTTAVSSFGFVVRVRRRGVGLASGSSPFADAAVGVSASALGFAGARRRRGLGADFSSAASGSATASGSSPLDEVAAVAGFLVRPRPPRVPRRRLGLAAAASSPSAGASAAASASTGSASAAASAAFVLDRDAAGFASPAFLVVLAVRPRRLRLRSSSSSRSPISRSNSGISNSAGSCGISSALGFASSSAAYAVVRLARSIRTL